VILVDDVVTTGTTLMVAAAALRAAGWQPVLGLAVAATPRHRDPDQGPGAEWVGAFGAVDHER
jgi:adenine/guanine phosphoribosyltransferase-like PRPP-binding protein